MDQPYMPELPSSKGEEATKATRCQSMDNIPVVLQAPQPSVTQSIIVASLINIASRLPFASFLQQELAATSAVEKPPAEKSPVEKAPIEEPPVEKPASSKAGVPSKPNNADRNKDSPQFNPMKAGAPMQLNNEIIKMIKANCYWHKFIVVGGAVYERTVVLKTFINGGHRTDFIPILYQIEGSDATFIAKECRYVLYKLFDNSFKLPLDGHTTDTMISVELILCFAHVDTFRLSVYECLKRCIRKRYDLKTRSLDLSNFSEEPDLVELFYCPLWLPEILRHVLLQVKTAGYFIITLNLSRNGLSLLKAHPLGWQDLSSLKKIDLSENEFDNLRSLKPLQCLKLTEIVLDKNPLCSLFSNAENYIRGVKSYFPNLNKLDGVYLCGENLPRWIPNYVSTPEGVDFIDQFLERYFTIYDSENRQWLKGMYHDEACFSMSAHYLAGQSTSSTARLTRYTMESRNLLKMSDYSKSLQLISRGPENVTAVLCRLPRTEHDPLSFSVDLVNYTPSYSMFTVTGVFREPSIMDQAVMRFFNRTFVVVKVGNMQYQICNEILLISNATTKQAEDSFKTTRQALNLTKMALSKFETLTDADRDRMVESMADLTEMNPSWAKKCLEESKWKFQEALQVFTELLKMDKIPIEAFMKV